MTDRLERIDRELLENWQRGLPLVPRPFAAMAEAMGTDEATVIARLARLHEGGTVARVGATLRPNTAGASTLAALSVPELDIERVAAIVGAEPGVNHSYLREHAWNLWFVVTAADTGALDATLARIGKRTGLRVLDLRLVRPFNIDLGFSLFGARHSAKPGARVETGVLTEADRPLLQALTTGLELTPRPFAALAARLGRDEDEVITRIARLAGAGILTRVGVIVRHRALGWRSNAMVVWKLPEERIEVAGAALARHPGVTLCYQRRIVPGVWEHGLFSMIHAKSRSEATGILADAAALPELAGAEYEVLFSLRCFKQTGALVAREPAA